MTKKNDKKTVVVFAGAGASKAVSPDDYPTTIDFFDRLPGSIRSNSMYQELLSFLLSKEGEGAKIDIEDILWLLQDLKVSLLGMVNQKTVLGWFASGNRLGGVIGMNGKNFGDLQQLASQGRSQIDNLIGNINQQVYTLYKRVPTKNELNSTWLPLLIPLYESGHIVELVTTNYDIILERTIEEITNIGEMRLITGRRGASITWLDTSLWEQNGFSRNERGLLTKLHGSVDWRRDDETIYTGTPVFSGDHDDHMILYPGFKGQPDQPEFQAFHTHFGGALERASAVVFIGFAFRDKHIEEICRDQLNDQALVFVLDPNPDLVIPLPGNQVEHFPKSFDAESAASLSRLVLSSLDN